ncbi:PREDICTED: protein FANTASTIC FOUR 1-like [Populus euphratica]|uniref:Protein FANTASTIC FOUR 1-like n=1 Tax=Populus euphratica TaxID=75702 RepID=A0AAJ6XQW4_POPEU|nr:PREDICTED: protein FANTASTIC FOUR 1-like [Populus euphratica]
MASNVSSLSSSTIVGECIGIESCLDLKNEDDIFTSSSNKEETNYESCSQRFHREKREQRWVKKKEFPPPIPLLARTENLSSHMPWVLKRYYTSDGRLILREEKFRPLFSSGDERRHVIENDIDQCYDNEDDGEEEQVLEQEHEEDDGENIELEEEEAEEEAVHDDQRVPSMESSESAGKCLNYNSVRTSSTCIFGVPVPAIRPVHT